MDWPGADGILPALSVPPGGGGGVLALEMGRGVPLACSKPDPVPIWKLTPNLIDRLMV